MLHDAAGGRSSWEKANSSRRSPSPTARRVRTADRSVSTDMSRGIPRPGHFLSHARAVKASSFFYDLPADRIATRPLADRSASNLLVGGGASPHAPSATQHHLFRDLPSLVPARSCIVMNSSRVIRARLPMRKSTGGLAEVMLLSPADRSDPALCLSAPLDDLPAWKVFIGGRRIRAGEVLTASFRGISVEATVLSREGAAGEVRFGGNAPSLAAALEALGQIPLPPYIKREADEGDLESYQTVYADRAGSVAAPTAGLHMTDDVLERLRQREVNVSRLTLHVGAGTFLPMGGETAGEHSMHEERFHVCTDELEKLAADARRQRPLIAIGTTSVRTLESIYWHGVKLLGSRKMSSECPSFCTIGQWDAYEALDRAGSVDVLPSLGDALDAVATAVQSSDFEGIAGVTRLLIVPGYPFRV